MTDQNRRPIAARSLGPIRNVASRLAASDVTPNQISQASVFFALGAFLAFAAVPHTGIALGVAALLVAALGIQLRLLCNLIDGMVAVEGEKSSATGPFWNEAPDRVADTLVLWGLGIAADWPTLGLIAAILAIATAYLRELGRAERLAPDFGGPLAKPQRMAVATGIAVLAALSLIFGAMDLAALVLTLGIWAIVLGTAATIFLRTRRLLRHLTLRG